MPDHFKNMIAYSWSEGSRQWMFQGAEVLRNKSSKILSELFLLWVKRLWFIA